MFCRQDWPLRKAMVVVVTTMALVFCNICLATAAPTSASAVNYQVATIDNNIINIIRLQL